MQATFYVLTILAVLGYIFGQLFDDKKILHLKKRDADNLKLYRRIWVAVKQANSQDVKIKVKVFPNIGRKLAEEIETVTDGNISADSYFGYSYSEILASLTPEQIEDIKSLRRFMAL